MISFNSVNFKYKSTDEPALSGLNFNLEQGSFHFLTGPSGAGKTTLFKMLYMDLLPTNGEMKLFGKNISTLSRNEIAYTRRKMGIVFQDFRLLEHLTVRENICLPLALHGPLSAEQEKCVDEILSWVGLSNKAKELPKTLSGGEKQRVAIARAVVNRPKILIADEPTGNIDDAMGKRIMHLFTELNRHGTTVIVATHDKGLIRSFNYPIIHLENGRPIHSVAA